MAVERSCGADQPEYPQTARSSSCLRKTRRGSLARWTSRLVLHVAQVEVLVVEARHVGIGVDRQRADPEHPVRFGAVGPTQDGS